MTLKDDYQLSRNAFGRLIFWKKDDGIGVEAVPVRAFPITTPEQDISLIDLHGHELAWIKDLRDLPDEIRKLIEEDLASREFMPEIERIRDVSSFSTPSTWDVETDRGRTPLILKGEEYIRSLTPVGLLITDSQGIHFL